jgi:hypothetical protein
MMLLGLGAAAASSFLVPALGSIVALGLLWAFQAACYAADDPAEQALVADLTGRQQRGGIWAVCHVRRPGRDHQTVRRGLAVPDLWRAGAVLRQRDHPGALRVGAVGFPEGPGRSSGICCRGLTLKVLLRRRRQLREQRQLHQ